jgi:crossover junction endodeoxyribonuclease RuvC
MLTTDVGEAGSRTYLGIDPGYDRVGVSILKKLGYNDTLLFSTCIITDKKADKIQRYLHISRDLNHIIDKYNPEVLGIESLFLFKNHKTVIAVAEAIGMIKYICAVRNIKIVELTPMQVKSSLTGNGHADKSQVEYMVRQILKLDKNIKIIDDELDAMAIGLTISAMRE